MAKCDDCNREFNKDYLINIHCKTFFLKNFIIFLGILCYYLICELIRISVIPVNRQMILATGILSASPNNAIAVVTIKTVGPTNASIVLI